MPTFGLTTPNAIWLRALHASGKSIFVVLVISLLLGYGAAWLIPATFTARTVFIPPQNQSTSAALAIGSLGALAGLAGGNLQVRTPGDQFLSMLDSNVIIDAVIAEFKLVEVYDVELMSDARKRLRKSTNAVLGKRDGLIYIDVEDGDPVRSADIANAYVKHLQALASRLTLTEAQQRRSFFEAQLKQTKDKLVAAQQALEASGFSSGVLRTEPRLSAETYSRISAEITATVVRLSGLRSQLQPNAPEVVAAEARLSALRRTLLNLETARDSGSVSADYIGNYREFKYQETLFDLFAKQYEAAKLDESREGAPIQVIDVAQPPDRRSRPVRLLIAALIAIIATSAYCLLIALRGRVRR